MTVLGPFNEREWKTLKRLNTSIKDPKTLPRRKEKETFLYKVILGKAA